MAVSEGSPTYDPGVRWNETIGMRPSSGAYGTPVAEGSGFKYDEATLHELVNEWSDLAQEYQDDIEDARNIAVAEPPGLEFASGDNADITRESGRALLEALDQRVAYCKNMAAKYVAALGKYARADEQAKIAITQQPEGIA